MKQQAGKQVIASQASQVPPLILAFEQLMARLDSPSKLIYGVLLVLTIVYSSVIPADYRTFADSLLGRVFGIGIVYGVIQSMGWVYGLLTAMAFLLVVTGASRAAVIEGFFTREGFDGGGTVSEKRVNGKRWFVEKVLGEHPKKIAVDRVTTTAPGDS